MSTSWWRLSLGTHPLARLLRNWSGPLIWTGAALTNTGCAEMWAENDSSQPEVGLDLQQQDGWNVGSEGQALIFPDAQLTDVSGGTGWRTGLTGLAPRLSPVDPRWQPYYAPALFQSLDAPRNADLRAAIRPVYTSKMAVGYRRGEALLSLFVQNGLCRQDVALVLDLPGPEAVAVAAALARCFDPVFLFDNWPHPKGVVPAHLTLGATLYFLPDFDRTRAARHPAIAPPVFVLDRQRLTPYADDAGQFDNRYFAGLPSWEGLHAAGIRHVLYVTADAAMLDGDDLNDDLVALDQAGIDVKLLALSDFSQTPLPGWMDDPASGCPPVSVSGAAPYYFGGSPASHGCFGWWYGFDPPQISLGSLHLPQVPASLAPRCRFRPSVRATAQALGGIHHSGGWHPGGHWGHAGFGRNGSMGRAHGGFSA